MAGRSYMERSLAWLKERDFLVEKVERYNAHAGVRRDLFGFLDVVALHPAHGVVGVQVCGPGDFAEHERKILDDRREALALWLLAGGRVVLQGWRSLKVGGWTPRHREFTLAADIPEITPAILSKLRHVENYEIFV